ncbi:hypothetical protein ACVWY3_001488 [Bradyrhizobium sp. USDA 4486]
MPIATLSCKNSDWSDRLREEDLKLDMLLPGITINTSPTDFAPIKQEQLIRFDGEKWERFGPDAENMR